MQRIDDTQMHGCRGGAERPRTACNRQHATCRIPPCTPCKLASEEPLQVHIVEELDDRKPLMSVGELAKGVMYHESMKTGLAPSARTHAH